MEEGQTKEKRRRTSNAGANWKEAMELAGLFLGLNRKDKAVVRELLQAMTSRREERKPPEA